MFEGLWQILFHYWLGIGLVVAAGLAWYFLPIGKNIAALAAVVGTVLLISYSIGISDGERRVHAQWDASLVKAAAPAKHRPAAHPAHKRAHSLVEDY